MENQEKQQEFRNKVFDLCEAYTNDLPVYEMVYELITHATAMSLYCAPNELVGMKTILACVEEGIKAYEETNS